METNTTDPKTERARKFERIARGAWRDAWRRQAGDEGDEWQENDWQPDWQELERKAAEPAWAWRAESFGEAEAARQWKERQ